ncbi:MAG: hypothetical protein WBV92_04915 [Nitrosotalea sp.]
MSDIRLILCGAAIIFAGFMLGAFANSTYAQFAVQQQTFDECYDYSTGVAVHVKCSEKTQDYLLYLALSIGLLGSGGVVIYKGIRGKWDNSVRDDEMVGPKNP